MPCFHERRGECGQLIDAGTLALVKAHLLVPLGRRIVAIIEDTRRESRASGLHNGRHVEIGTAGALSRIRIAGCWAVAWRERIGPDDLLALDHLQDAPGAVLVKAVGAGHPRAKDAAPGRNSMSTSGVP